MSTSRVLNGLDGLIQGGFFGGLTGGTSALIGSGVTRVIGLLSSTTPIAPIVAAGTVGVSLFGAGIYACRGFFGESTSIASNSSTTQQEEYNAAAMGTFLTTGLGIAGSLLLKACSQPNPAMRDFIPAMFIGAAILQYSVAANREGTAPSAFRR